MKTSRENHFLSGAILRDQLATLKLDKNFLFFCRLCKLRAAGCSRWPAARHGHELSPAEEEENVAPLNSTEWNKPPRQFSLIFSSERRRVSSDFGSVISFWWRQRPKRRLLIFPVFFSDSWKCRQNHPLISRPHGRRKSAFFAFARVSLRDARKY